MLWRSTITATALAMALLLGVPAAQAHDESKYPDWSGQWRRTETGTPRYDPSKPADKQQAPLTKKYRKIHEASMTDQAKGGQGLYISVKCIPMGMPYQMSIFFPFEFVITAKTTFVLYEPMTSQPRRIYTDGRDWPKNRTRPSRLFDRQMDRSRQRRQVRRARNRDPAHARAAHL
jgi:hypothetical protein